MREAFEDNILMQAMARGHLSSLEQARAVVRHSFEPETYQPGGDRAAWEEAYARYLALSVTTDKPGM